ncbi:MAG TPA: LLM class flavin-dependent oxidoreductase [Hyphomicrobiaceae bacterium]|nr:LLM class flavin-dependent oxidoreductase [Hyphomicrobiaceae bacterium]
MADFPVSVLDQSPIIGGATPADAIRSTIELARLADKLGYHRYWLAEHHGLLGLADASPEILLARLGAETERIRIGTGGIMLPYYASFKIAEQFKMLEALYPGRIDLGLGRAPGGHPRTARVLFDGKPMDSEEGFVRQLMELSAIFKGTVPDGHPLHGEIANPVGPTSPEMWVLGSSTGGASFAAHLGMNFAFAHFINAYTGAQVAHAYREHFCKGHDEAPRLALAMIALCADSPEEAQLIEKAMLIRWAWAAMGINKPLLTLEEAAAYQMSEREAAIAARERPRATIGSVDEVSTRIVDLKTEFNADEVIVVAIAPSYEIRTRTLTQLATALGLQEQTAA